MKNKNPNSRTDKISVSRIAAFTLLSMILALGAACSMAGKPAENKPAETKASTNSSPASSSAGTSAATSGDMAGTYSVNGTGIDGKTYQGEMDVTKRDAVYQLSWTIGSESYDGIALKNGNTVSAAYTTGTNGKGCGAVIYKINPDGSLDGTWGEWGVNSAGTEKAVQVGETSGGVGTFDVTGTNADGSAYKGKLTVTKGPNDIYQFKWDTGNNFIGTGVKMGDYLAAGSGTKQCGFVIYEAKGNTLEGKWGVPGATSLGTENATQK